MSARGLKQDAKNAHLDFSENRHKYFCTSTAFSMLVEVHYI